MPVCPGSRSGSATTTPPLKATEEGESGTAMSSAEKESSVATYNGNTGLGVRVNLDKCHARVNP